MTPIPRPPLVASANPPHDPDRHEQRHDAERHPHRNLEAIDPATHLLVGIRRRLRCPACGRRLFSTREELTCNNPICARRYPIVDTIPVLIDETKSLFDIADFVEHRPTTWPARPWITRLAARCIPKLSLHTRSQRNMTHVAALLLHQRKRPRVLVIGGHLAGHGMEALFSTSEITLVETDVTFGPRTQLICDAHALPFADGTFDGVIIQAVLQYVQDPRGVVEEIHRVLSDDGIVYAEAPFVQHGLEGYDFNRFTMLGLRRLFQRYEEIDAGPLVGPASMLSWSLQYFLLSFVSGRTMRALTKGSARMVFFWVKHVDHLLLNRPGAADASGELFYLGKKSENILSDRELVRTHRKFW